MLFHVFAREELATLFELLSYSSIVGPVVRAVTPAGEQIHGFAHVEDFSLLAIDYPTTAHSAKAFFLPHLETVASYQVNGSRWQQEDEDEVARPTVLFGLHACDINALNRLDRILLGGRCPDEQYRQRRHHTFIVGVDCCPTPHCFCKSLGCDRALHGYDLFLTDLGDNYFCEINSSSAFEVLRGLKTREAGPEDHSAFVQVRARRDAMFSCSIDTADLTRILDMEFAATAWQRWGQQCLFCGICANVCPTCYCYGVEHLVETCLTRAKKVRRLYSCNLVDFAEVAESRNFRPESASRIKYRYYHKHRGFVERFEESLCVGCGRCGRACLAGITVPEVINSIRAEAAGHE